MTLRFKRHYKLLVLLALISAVLVAGAGGERIVAYSVPDREEAAGQAITVTGLAVSQEPAAVSSEVLIVDASNDVVDAVGR